MDSSVATRVSGQEGTPESTIREVNFGTPSLNAAKAAPQTEDVSGSSPRVEPEPVASQGCGMSVCKHRMHVKRMFLPLAGGAWLTTLAPMRTYVYFPIIVFSVAFVLFWNFPCVVTFANSRPLYYEDVFSVDAPACPKHESIRRRFEGAYEWSLIVVNALFAAALAEYWLYQTGSSASYTEILGVTGGIMKVFQTVNYASGSVIIAVTRWHVRALVESDGPPREPGEVVVEIVPKINQEEDGVQLVVGERASPPIAPVTMTAIEI